MLICTSNFGIVFLFIHNNSICTLHLANRSAGSGVLPFRYIHTSLSYSHKLPLSSSFSHFCILHSGQLQLHYIVVFLCCPCIDPPHLGHQPITKFYFVCFFLFIQRQFIFKMTSAVFSLISYLSHLLALVVYTHNLIPPSSLAEAQLLLFLTPV